MSILLNYNKDSNDNSNRLEFKDLINDSRLKINNNTRAKSNDFFNIFVYFYNFLSKINIWILCIL